MIKYLPLNVYRFNNNPANIVGCATSATSLKKHCLVKQKKRRLLINLQNSTIFEVPTKGCKR